MVEIVRVGERMREHEGRIEFAIDVDHAVEMLLVQFQRIVAAVEELDLSAEQVGGALGLILAAGLHALERRAFFLPGELAFAALAEGEAHNLHAIAVLDMQCDRAAGAPDEIAGMGGDDETRSSATSRAPCSEKCPGALSAFRSGRSSEGGGGKGA